MPGFLGGGGGGGTGGEIEFPKELIDPVTKLRVSQPENLIDTDFEYGLQPTKWETLELINNTPSFFSKSGDTTIDGIVSITTNSGTREITVRTSLDHNLAVGIPLNVTGSKSITADGAYIINSIPDAQTFTYLCKDNQPDTLSIEDLYTSIITGEFFQGSQIRISDAGGMTTDNATPESTITVNLDSTHGFGVNTPFYFLNLNSSLSQQFDASNSSSKSFDASNTATAQTFDGSNTLSSSNIDYSNSATLSGTVSNITATNTVTDEITVQHTTENFSGRPLGTPLYYNVTASSGFFATNPRGVVFLKTTVGLGTSSSVFQVSETPDGAVIDIVATFTGTFQLANQARTFAGNNRNPLTETALTIVKEAEFVFDGNNQGFAGNQTNGLATVEGYSGTILVSTPSGSGLDYYIGAMLRYNSTGAAATGLVSGTTYFVSSFVQNPNIPNLYNITITALPATGTNITPSGGSGVQTFQKIGVSIDKDIIHIRNANFVVRDMIEYTFPEGARFTAATAEQTKVFYFVKTAYDAHNYELNDSLFSVTNATGGVVTTTQILGTTYNVHTFTTVGTSNFNVSSVGTSGGIQYLIVAGGGAGGNGMGGGGGGGGLVHNLNTALLPITAGTYPIVVGAGAVGTTANLRVNGGDSTAFGITAFGGGGGGSLRLQREAGITAANPGGSGGGAGGLDSPGTGGAATQTNPTIGQGFGFAGGNFPFSQQNYPGAGGGGAGQAGFAPLSSAASGGNGGSGLQVNIDGAERFYSGGGAGNAYVNAFGGDGGIGGGAGGSVRSDGGPGARGRGYPLVQSRSAGGDGVRANDGNGGDAGANTGGGGGGAAWQGGRGGNGGSGIVIVRYPITPLVPFTPANATGGTINNRTQDGITYRTHVFTTVGTSNFAVSDVGSLNSFEYLIVAGGGGGGGSDANQGLAGGGGAGGLLTGTATLNVQSYPIVVGNGGAPSTGANKSFNGGNSSALGLTAIGGGNGGNWWNPINNGGGSGGGGGNQDGGNFVGGTGTAPQGRNGGNGSPYNNGSPNPSAGGGGGGWGSAGENAFSGAGGRGGFGFVSSISGATLTFAAGGGGGGTVEGGLVSFRAGRGRSGFGNGFAAEANSGSGGGAACSNSQSNTTYTGGAGGSGIVVIRYPISIAT